MGIEPGRRDVVVATLEDLQERERIIVEVDGLEMGLYWHRGEVRAWRNVCPHQGGPVCQGKIMPRTIQRVREDGKSGGLGFSDTDRNIVCPWHGAEFDILTGVHPSSAGMRLGRIPARIVEGNVVVTV